MTYLHTHTGPTLVTYNFYELSTWQEGEGEEKRERNGDGGSSGGSGKGRKRNNTF